MYALVITSSPGPTPMARRAHSSAAVAEANVAARSACAKRAISRSNSFVFGPVVIQPLLSASATSSSSAWVMSGGENEMRFCSVKIAPWYPINDVRPA